MSASAAKLKKVAAPPISTPFIKSDLENPKTSMVIWQPISLTSDSIQMERNSSIVATPFFLNVFFISEVATVSKPGI
ncbi:uncharacterized protein METZ01_LOCUS226719, partial [marine metagenome]